MKINDKVIYIKDKKKIIYIIKEMFQDEALIKGVNYRILLFVKVNDLKPATLEDEKQEKLFRHVFIMLKESFVFHCLLFRLRFR